MVARRCPRRFFATTFVILPQTFALRRFIHLYAQVGSRFSLVRVSRARRAGSIAADVYHPVSAKPNHGSVPTPGGEPPGSVKAFAQTHRCSASAARAVAAALAQGQPLHRQLSLPQSSSASHLTAGATGFLLFTQSRESLTWVHMNELISLSQPSRFSYRPGGSRTTCPP